MVQPYPGAHGHTDATTGTTAGSPMQLPRYTCPGSKSKHQDSTGGGASRSPAQRKVQGRSSQDSRPLGRAGPLGLQWPAQPKVTCGQPRPTQPPPPVGRGREAGPLTVHLCGFSPVCRRMCTTSMYCALKGFCSRVQACQRHTNSFFSPWMCSLLMCCREQGHRAA